MIQSDVQARPFVLTGWRDIDPARNVLHDPSWLCGTRVGQAACPESDNGAFPGFAILEEGDSIDKGKPGDLCPRCAISQMANVGHWNGHGGTSYPQWTHRLRMFKCKAGAWIAFRGLDNADATKIEAETPDESVV